MRYLIILIMATLSSCAMDPEQRAAFAQAMMGINQGFQQGYARQTYYQPQYLPAPPPPVQPIYQQPVHLGPTGGFNGTIIDPYGNRTHFSGSNY